MQTPISRVRQDDTHRLIPSRYADESVLTRLTDDPATLQSLFELEGATNDRLLGEAGLLPGISVRELVFGLPYSHIVNATFTHALPTGSRFNGPDRGCWYAAFALQTSAIEVAYHKSNELKEINWKEPEKFTYVDLLADFRAEFHDLRGGRGFTKYLDPHSYAASQRLASELLDEGSEGVIYPSVRHKEGTCIACFRPALVNNVRKSSEISITFSNAHAAPELHL